MQWPDITRTAVRLEYRCNLTVTSGSKIQMFSEIEKSFYNMPVVAETPTVTCGVTLDTVASGRTHTPPCVAPNLLAFSLKRSTRGISVSILAKGISAGGYSLTTEDHYLLSNCRLSFSGPATVLIVPGAGCYSIVSNSPTFPAIVLNCSPASVTGVSPEQWGPPQPGPTENSYEITATHLVNGHDIWPIRTWIYLVTGNWSLFYTINNIILKTKRRK